MEKEQVEAEIQLFVEKRSNRARNEAIGILGFLGVLVGIISTLGIWGQLTKYVDNSIQNNVDAGVVKNLKQLNEEAEDLLDEIKNKNEIILDASDGLIVELYEHKWSGWYSKANTDISSQLPNNVIITNINFKHPLHKNQTCDESFRVEYAKVRFVTD